MTRLQEIREALEAERTRLEELRGDIAYHEWELHTAESDAEECRGRIDELELDLQAELEANTVES